MKPPGQFSHEMGLCIWTGSKRDAAISDQRTIHGTDNVHEKLRRHRSILYEMLAGIVSGLIRLPLPPMQRILLGS